MHYLTELAGKLVTAYQDRENISLWLAPHQGQDTQQMLATALRAVLEQEVAGGRLQCIYVRADENTAMPSPLNSLEGKERIAS